MRVRLFKVLGYTGALPFWVFATLIATTYNPHHVVVVSLAHMIYGSMILSFLGGTLWMRALQDENKILMSVAMLPTIISGFIIMAYAILQFSGMFAPMPLASLLLYMAVGVLFVMLMLIERKALDYSTFPKGYYCLRKNLTILAALSYLIVIMI